MLSAASRDSRVLVLSQRELHQPVWHAWQYEFENVLGALDDVSYVTPRATSTGAVGRSTRRVVNGVLHRAGRPRTLPHSVYPSMRRTRVDSQHDLFFAIIHHPYQLAYLHRLEGWAAARRKVCMLVEVWSPDLEQESDFLEVLREFDDVYVCNSAVLPGLERLGVSAPEFLPLAVDARRFCPLPRLPPRSVDVYTFGRTSPAVHRQLLDMVEEQGLTYVYDTIRGLSTVDHEQHRALVANLMKRSRYFLAHRINDSPERLSRTHGEEGLSTRYFEGIAGGAVLLGSRTRTSEFDDCFDWEDVVIDLPYDADDVSDALRDLSRQPERLAAARAANVCNSLLRHDWSHRWQRVLSGAGLAATPEVGRRQEVLSALADAATPERFLQPAAGHGDV